jgi:predicted RNA binding protein YcfA (HicA-like mRNA interferase family)
MSQSKQATYRDLAVLLEELGFRGESVKGSHQAFRHVASDTLILLAPLASNDTVRREDLISVRRHLDSKCLMDSATFDRRLPQSALEKTNP